MHAGMHRLVRDLNQLLRSTPALHQLDFVPAGFEWISLDDAEQSVLSFIRRGEAGAPLIVVVCNFTPTVHHHYRVGVPQAGTYRERLNTDSAHYGGSNVGTPYGQVSSQPVPWNGRPHSIELTLAAVGEPVLRMQSLSGLQPGRPWPLGASWDGRGVNFAVYSGHAHSMELCLFDADGRHEQSRTALPGHTHDIWHGYLEGAAPGLVYGYRAHGQWRPDRGHRFNAHKLLLDPYAREIVGSFEWRDEQFGGDPRHTGHLDGRDNADVRPQGARRRFAPRLGRRCASAHRA